VGSTVVDGATVEILASYNLAMLAMNSAMTILTRDLNELRPPFSARQKSAAVDHHIGRLRHRAGGQ
jgi:hypothetical protein